MSVVTKEMMIEAYEGWKRGAKKTDTVMFLHQRLFHQTGILCAMNNTEMKTQMREWGKGYKTPVKQGMRSHLNALY